MTKIIPSPYCTTSCGRAARDDQPIAFYRKGQPMTLVCTHYYTTKEV